MNGKQRIGYLMAATGLTITDLAKQHGYTKQAFYDLLKGRTRTPHLRQLVSDITGLPVSKLWPEENKNALNPCERTFPVGGDVGRTSDPIRG